MPWHTPRTWNVGELVTKVMLDEQIRDNMNYLFSAAYPIGSIYIETTGVNPGMTFAFGTWVAFGTGRVLIGVGTSDAVYAAGASGGESNHTLIAAEMPTHHHTYSDPYNPAVRAQDGTDHYMVNYGGVHVQSNSSDTGGGGAHNNLPPYVVVYMWQRTA
jgi:microcystin-dependent protein